MTSNFFFYDHGYRDIRKNLIRRGYIKGIIGLPANLFYGTGIPACIVVIDKAETQARKGIFMLDASAGFTKDGPKNRLREQDLHKIVDVFNKKLELPKYSRMVSLEEIEKNEFNLNLPRYIDNQQAEDLQDIEGHLKGGIPMRDVNALQAYWEVCPQLQQVLFMPNRTNYVDLAIAKQDIKTTIYAHPEFAGFIAQMNAHFATWQHATSAQLKQLQAGFHPKQLIHTLGEQLLAHYNNQPLIDQYDVYQHLMNYWAETMQDDAYLIAVDGWQAPTYRVIEKDKKGKEKDKGWACDLIPKQLIVDAYFTKEQQAINEQNTVLESTSAQLTELEEEHGGEDGLFSELDKINKANVSARLKEIKYDADAKEEVQALNQWLTLNTKETELKKAIKEAETTLDLRAYQHYPKLTEAEIKTLVVDNKWLSVIDSLIHGEMDSISQALTQRVKELAERYETPMPMLAKNVIDLESKVQQHLSIMGFAWV